MSAQGHFHQIDPLPTLSACPLRSDRVRTFRTAANRRFVPQPDSCTAASSLDDLVSDSEEPIWHGHADGLGGFQVDH
jgi:hypothetical protein